MFEPWLPLYYPTNNSRGAGQEGIRLSWHVGNVADTYLNINTARVAGLVLGGRVGATRRSRRQSMRHLPQPPCPFTPLFSVVSLAECFHYLIEIARFFSPVRRSGRFITTLHSNIKTSSKILEILVQRETSNTFLPVSWTMDYPPPRSVIQCVWDALLACGLDATINYLVGPKHTVGLLTLNACNSAVSSSMPTNHSFLLSVAIAAIAEGLNLPINYKLLTGCKLVYNCILLPIYAGIIPIKTDVENRGALINGSFSVFSFCTTLLLFYTPRICLQITIKGVAASLLLWLPYHFSKRFSILSEPMESTIRQGLWKYCLMLPLGAAYAGQLVAIRPYHSFLSAYNTYMERKQAEWIKEASKRPSYSYRPLSPNKEIRLLKLLRRSPFTELTCEMHHVSLDNPPPFEAISYTWGNSKPTDGILVDDFWLPITPTISKLLWYRRTYSGPLYFWIDAICINQKDDAEKSRQIPLMRDIYHNASRVVVWLASPLEVHDAARAHQSLVFFSCFQDLGMSWEQLYQSIITGGDDGATIAIAKLFDHQWFSRCWVIQEVAVARTVHIMYGGITMDWSTLVEGVKVLLHPKIAGPSLNPVDRPEMQNALARASHTSNVLTIDDARNSIKAGRLLSLADALLKFRSFKSSLPHDKIYSLLGLTVDGFDFVQIPEYNIPVEDLYVDVANYLFSRPDPLCTLHAAGIGFHRAYQKLPSWVADWTSSSIARHSIQREHHDSLTPVSRVERLRITNSKSICLKGIRVDRIHVLGKTLGPDTQSRANVLPTVLEQVNELREWYYDGKSLASTHKERLVLNGQCLEEAYWRCLMESEDDATEASTQQNNAWTEYEWFLDCYLKIMQRTEAPQKDTTEIDELTFKKGMRINETSFKFGLGKANLRFCITENGFMGMIPPESIEGDLIYKVSGIDSFFVFRMLDTGQYALVGGCRFKDLLLGTDDLTWENLPVV